MMLFPGLLLLSVFLHCSGLDMCSVCSHFPLEDEQCPMHIQRFIRSLGHMKYKLHRDLRYVTSQRPAILIERSNATSIFECYSDDMLSDMLISFRALTELATNLSMANSPPHSSVYSYNHFISRSLCQLNQVFRGMNYPLPESVCRVPTPDSLEIIQTNIDLDSFIVSTLHRGKALMEDIKRHFEDVYSL